MKEFQIRLQSIRDVQAFVSMATTRPFTITVPQMYGEEGEPLDCPRTPQMVFTMQLPKPVPAYSLVRHAVELSGK